MLIFLRVRKVNYKGILGLIGYLIFLFGNLLYFLKFYLQTLRKTYEKAIFLGATGMFFAMVCLGVTYTTIQADRVAEFIFILLAMTYACKSRLTERSSNS